MSDDRLVESGGNMTSSRRAESLATRFESAMALFRARLEAVPADLWSTWLPDEEKTVAALAHHVAWAVDMESALFSRFGQGLRDSGWTATWLDTMNREQAAAHAHDAQDQVRDLLDHHTAVAAARIRAMSDAELDRVARHMPGEPERSVAEWIEVCLIAHPLEHLRSLPGE